jgi:DNA-binding LacI/PurR family transcriptional regulator
VEEDAGKKAGVSRNQELFCFNDLLALGVMRALHDAGCYVPDDVAVVGFDDIEEGLFATPSLTTVSPDKEEIGRVVVSLLLQRFQGIRTGPPERVVPPFRLVVRESTAGTDRGALPIACAHDRLVSPSSTANTEESPGRC